MIPISYNVRSLLVRRATTLAAVTGIALVSFVFSGVLMLSAGIDQTLDASGKTDHAIVMRKGSDGELSSGMEAPNVSVIGAAPGVKRGSDGQPLVVGEIVMVAAMTKTGTASSLSNVAIRGVPESVWKFRPEVKFIEGREPRAGTDEAAVGARIRGRFDGLDMGKTVELKKNRPITVVGVFEAAGSAFESEIWLDVDTLAQAFGRSGSVSAVRVNLDSPSSFEAFEASVESDKRLGLDAQREKTYYANQSQGTSGFISGLGWVISGFFGVGAMIGAAITMFASVAHRQKEIGTMRALGFGQVTILASFLLESTLIAIIGGVIGMVAALALGFVKVGLMNQANWSEMIFTFTPTPITLAIGLGAAVGMGILGGFVPALQAARLSPVNAMRD